MKTDTEICNFRVIFANIINYLRDDWTKYKSFVDKISDLCRALCISVSHVATFKPAAGEELQRRFGPNLRGRGFSPAPPGRWYNRVKSVVKMATITHTLLTNKVEDLIPQQAPYRVINGPKKIPVNCSKKTLVTSFGKRSGRKYSYAEVAKHCTADDCWIIISNSVYNVTRWVHFPRVLSTAYANSRSALHLYIAMVRWIPRHPGGDVILKFAGHDCTEQFAAFHRPSLYKLLSSWKIGEIDNPKPVSKLTSDYRALRQKLYAEGYFDPQLSYFLLKDACLALLGTTSRVLRLWQTLVCAAEMPMIHHHFWRSCIIALIAPFKSH